MKGKSESGRTCEMKGTWLSSCVCSGLWRVLQTSLTSIVRRCVHHYYNLARIFLYPVIPVVLFNSQVSLLLGNKCRRCCPGVLLAAPPPPRCDWQLSISVNHQPSPLQPKPRACARWALNWCSVLRYQMARQMTSPWPHYTRTQRRGGVLTEQRADPTRTTSQHANPWKFTDEDSPQNSAVYLHTHRLMAHVTECKWIFIPFYFFFLPTPNYWLSLSVIIQHSLSSLQSLLTDRTWKEEGAWLSTSHEKQR